MATMRGAGMKPKLTWVEWLLVVAFLLSGLLATGIIWIAVHFVRKFW